MNTITYSDFKATLINKSSLVSGAGYNVEISKEGKEWGIMAVAYWQIYEWKLSHIRIIGSEDRYPNTHDISEFFRMLYIYLYSIMERLIPSHQNTNNEQV